MRSCALNGCCASRRLFSVTIVVSSSPLATSVLPALRAAGAPAASQSGRRIVPMRIALSRAPSAEREVTPLELFFDLVYVFAISQLSHHLLEHVDVRTGAETVILALAVFYAWYMTAWGANWLDPDPLPVRAALVGLMFASLLLGVGVGR